VFNPLETPRRSFEGFGEILSFVNDFAIPKLHDADGGKQKTAKTCAATRDQNSSFFREVS
jgi:hypothetical protein